MESYVNKKPTLYDKVGFEIDSGYFLPTRVRRRLFSPISVPVAEYVLLQGLLYVPRRILPVAL